MRITESSQIKQTNSQEIVKQTNNTQHSTFNIQQTKKKNKKLLVPATTCGR